MTSGDFLAAAAASDGRSTAAEDDVFRDPKIKNLIERANNLIMSLVTVGSVPGVRLDYI